MQTPHASGERPAESPPAAHGSSVQAGAHRGTPRHAGAGGVAGGGVAGWPGAGATGGAGQPSASAVLRAPLPTTSKAVRRPTIMCSPPAAVLRTVHPDIT
ncbi:hypothetical protein GCM10010515_25710 [Streptomyces fructofermentans]|uniref:Uncharacterized protein n=1 Tax=Streptomyces fructofermentans TaxID=152141 RepID=A0A918KAK1_9ACTN|nr:hypothetical protein GCM10010515_25710 [Streptomyces fructofermentans]